MRASLTWLALLLAFGCPAGARSADDKTPTVDAVLARWEAALQKCRTLDARLTVLEYDRVFHADKPAIRHGRFYFEAPNLGRYELQEAPGVVDARAETVVWNEKDVLWFDAWTRHVNKISREKSPAPSDLSKKAPAVWSLLDRIEERFRSPQELLPLVVDIRAAEVRRRFDVTLEPAGRDEMMLKALPRSANDRECFREVNVLIDAKTHLTRAMQTVSPNGTQWTVFLLEDVKINQRPDDRDQLLHPSLTGYRVLDFP